MHGQSFCGSLLLSADGLGSWSINEYCSKAPFSTQFAELLVFPKRMDSRADSAAGRIEYLGLVCAPNVVIGSRGDRTNSAEPWKMMEDSPA